MTKLIALAVIAAGAIAGITEDIAAGASFEVPPETAEPLLTAGQAKLADAPLAPPVQAATPPAPAPKPRAVKARLLLTTAHGNADDVVTLPAEIARQLQEQGQIDTGKEAVAYAMTLPQNQKNA